MLENESVSIEKLTDFCQEIFISIGVPREEASIISKHIIYAEMDGLASHGVSRMELYTRRLACGVVNPRFKYTIEQASPSCEVWNAHNSHGMVVGAEAMKRAINLASQTGVGIVLCNHSNHCGQTGQYVKMATDAGMVGVCSSNAPSLMAPWGGAEAYLGTNPIGIGVPTHSIPVMLDMATSKVAMGKVLVALKSGTTIPDDWALDKDGNPTTDPAAALNGTALPFGGVKGSGLALFADVFSGVLSGAAFGSHIHNFAKDFDTPQNVGHFFMAIDISKIMDLEKFKDRMETFRSELKALRKKPGVEEILLPGEIEQRKHQEAVHSGMLSIPTPVMEELRNLGKKYGVAASV